MVHTRLSVKGSVCVKTTAKGPSVAPVFQAFSTLPTPALDVCVTDTQIHVMRRGFVNVLTTPWKIAQLHQTATEISALNAKKILWESQPTIDNATERSASCKSS